MLLECGAHWMWPSFYFAKNLVHRCGLFLNLSLNLMCCDPVACRQSDPWLPGTKAMPPSSAMLIQTVVQVSFMLTWLARTYLLAHYLCPRVPSQVAPPCAALLTNQDMSYNAQERKVATRPWELSREMHATWYSSERCIQPLTIPQFQTPEGVSLSLYTPSSIRSVGPDYQRYTAFMLRLRCVYGLG